MNRYYFVSLVIGCSTIVGCAATEPAASISEDELGTTYGTFLDTLQDEEHDAWIHARRRLREGFDRVCGNTICSGDFSNLATVSLTCSSTHTQRKMKDCVWVLGGNIDHIDPVSGRHSTEARTFACSIPVGGTAATFLGALTDAGEDAIHTPLPGTNGSFYDGLVACFDGVSGAAAPPSAAGDHVELSDFLWERSADRGVTWSETQRSLAAAFDEACGDSFCEGEYADVTALRLACDVRRTDEHVGDCHWTFAQAASEVDARGRIITRHTTTTCTIPIDGPASALVSALAAKDALRAKLPGTSGSLYDALIDCL